ncbi:hypothetical protein CAOG_04333 [Capsaspora owczarzaki ATCC 30864]|uniref:Uncharacterized protein n=1 Tax=Capsaspora owczarzaki (strain ATCC 30864) TaxID=595528 RepID=A0A0D2VRP9_CAPO3|nr:hypothetical protein CAOG_04333 [Capsaspora owczarzaki ATCC 30864]KJE93567.1 hypothetical protein CAOG_004333 [Capsaspora owczarzaki ATCC 30864]|eukprot:XP_004348161.1 hypothetical protein CAOG_04333 [Capsaspora owczarzaki ATCC 30864]
MERCVPATPFWTPDTVDWIFQQAHANNIEIRTNHLHVQEKRSIKLGSWFVFDSSLIRRWRDSYNWCKAYMTHTTKKSEHVYRERNGNLYKIFYSCPTSSPLRLVCYTDRSPIANVVKNDQQLVKTHLNRSDQAEDASGWADLLRQSREQPYYEQISLRPLLPRPCISEHEETQGAGDNVESNSGTDAFQSLLWAACMEQEQPRPIRAIPAETSAAPSAKRTLEQAEQGEPDEKVVPPHHKRFAEEDGMSKPSRPSPHSPIAVVTNIDASTTHRIPNDPTESDASSPPSDAETLSPSSSPRQPPFPNLPNLYPVPHLSERWG